MDFTRAHDILKTAEGLVGGERAATHGDKTRNHQAIAAVWNGIAAARRVWRGDVPLEPEDVALMMVGLKIARALGGGYNPDDYVDMAGYAGVAGEIRARREAVTDSHAKAGTQ